MAILTQKSAAPTPEEGKPDFDLSLLDSLFLADEDRPTPPRKRGGARPGAGRKKGVSYIPEAQRKRMRTLYLDDICWEKLKLLAEERGESVSGVMREIILKMRKKKLQKVLI